MLLTPVILNYIDSSIIHWVIIYIALISFYPYNKGALKHSRNKFNMRENIIPINNHIFNGVPLEIW